MINDSTVSAWVKWAEVSLYLSKNEYEFAKVLQGVDNTKKCRLIYLTKQIVKRWQPYYSGTKEFDRVASYLYALIGKWALKASTTTGVGIVIGKPIMLNPSSNAAYMAPYPINITISSEQGGVMTLQDDSWVGLESVNEVVINQSLFQLGTQFTFNKNTGTFDFSPSSYELVAGDKVTSFGYILKSTSGSLGHLFSLAVKTERVQITVGPSADIHNGDTSFSISDTNVIENSLSVSIDSVGPLPIGSFGDRKALVSVGYSPSGISMTFNEAAITGQVYVITYLKYTSA